jgi:hypothetical protein
MKIQQIIEIATKKGVDYGNETKTELIKAIQRAEGNPDCFARLNVNDCNQMIVFGERTAQPHFQEADTHT